MYELTYISPAAMSTGYLRANGLFFNRHWGAFYMIAGGYISRIFHDGTLRPTSVAGLGVWSYLWPVAGADGELYCTPWFMNYAPIYPTWPLTGTINDSVPSLAVTPAITPPTESLYFYDPVDDLVVYCLNHTLQVHDGQTKALIRSLALGSGIYRSLSWVREGVIFAADRTTGNTCFYNYLRGELLGSGKIAPFYAAAFDPLLQVIAAIDTDYKMRIYCLEDLPVNLSDPVASPAPGVGLASRLTVQLTGDRGEALPGRWVSWDLAGVGGPVLGALQKAVSETDTEGYARNLYYGPQNDTGQVQVVCEVEI